MSDFELNGRKFIRVVPEFVNEDGKGDCTGCAGLMNSQLCSDLPGCVEGVDENLHDVIFKDVE